MRAREEIEREERDRERERGREKETEREGETERQRGGKKGQEQVRRRYFVLGRHLRRIRVRVVLPDNRP
eukprot:1344055-Amorphochlora_amoeboformis.AAC.1